MSTIGQGQQTSTFDGKPVFLEAKGRVDDAARLTAHKVQFGPK